MKNAKTTEKKNYRVKIMLGVVFFLAVALIYSTVRNSSGEEHIEPLSPNKVKPSVATISPAMGTVEPVSEEDKSGLLDDKIDKLFCSLAKSSHISASSNQTSSQSITPQPLPLLSGIPKQIPGGVKIKLPDLKNPSLLRPSGSEPIVFNGIPTALTQSNLSLLQINIGGIACNHGTCKATTTAGNIAVGDTIGGGQNIVEKIQTISVSGIKTDKRFISY